MKKLIIISLCIITSLFISCDISAPVLDTPLGEEAIANQASINKSALAPVYAAYRSLYGVQDRFLTLQSVASVEGIVPFRGGTDWYDGGRYIAIHQHKWTPRSRSVVTVWKELTSAIAKAAYAQKVISNNMNKPNAERLLAEARALDAFWNQLLLNLYGVAAYKNPANVAEQNNEFSDIYRGKEAVEYILNQYNKAISDLGTYNNVGTTRFTKAAVWAFKARLFMNKTFTLNPYAEDLNYKTQAMDSVIYYTTKVINTGDYKLTDAYFAIWNVHNHNNTEIIFAFNQSIENNGSNRLAYFPMSRAMHGSLEYFSANGTDAYSFTARFYHLFDGHHSDPRFYKQNLPKGGCISEEDYDLDRGIQVGKQYGLQLNSSGTDYKRCANGKLKIVPLVDFARSGKPVIYTVEVGLVKNNGQVNGTRPFKFDFDPMDTGDHVPSRVDIPVMRYAEMYFLRAEAYLRKGNTAMALHNVNIVRKARGVKPAKSMNLERMMKEWAWEFYFEFHWRRIQIRYGTYEDDWVGKTNSDPTRRIYPIPAKVINSASVREGYLEQNKGY